MGEKGLCVIYFRQSGKVVYSDPDVFLIKPFRLGRSHHVQDEYKKALSSILQGLFIDWELLSLTIITMVKDQTQPVGFGRPAILHAPLPGPDGNSS